MNRFLTFITCVFVGMAATLVSSCTPRSLVPEPMAPPPSAGLAYESGSASGLHYGPLLGVQYGYYGPPPGQYYGPPPDQYYGPPHDQYYGPPPGDDQYYGSPPGGQYHGPPPGGPQYAPIQAALSAGDQCLLPWTRGHCQNAPSESSTLQRLGRRRCLSAGSNNPSSLVPKNLDDNTTNLFGVMSQKRDRES
jgi:hypothetical protein